MGETCGKAWADLEDIGRLGSIRKTVDVSLDEKTQKGKNSKRNWRWVLS